MKSGLMKSGLTKSAFFLLALSSAMAVGTFALEDSAQAATRCAGAGWLCFHDDETGHYGNVAYNNANWAVLPGNWLYRADWFWNDGRYDNVCIYDLTNYRLNYQLFYLQRGESTTNWEYFSNFGASNYWTPGDIFSCPNF